MAADLRKMQENQGFSENRIDKFRFVFLFVLKMGNSDWNCPLIALIMRFFLVCTDFCIK